MRQVNSEAGNNDRTRLTRLGIAACAALLAGSTVGMAIAKPAPGSDGRGGSSGVAPADPAPAPDPAADGPVVQLALLLDTSNSMDGLINQAKTQLWSVVNELALARRNGKAPSLRVSLYQYGNDSLNPETGWVQLVLPFTNDLDLVSEKLFSLTTHGGTEMCGTVIRRALDQLSWTDSADDLRMIVIAGNEPFDQGAVDFRSACKDSGEDGVIINTIFCGPHDEGVRTFWLEGAALAGGKFLNIDGDAVTPHIPAPQDDDLRRLGDEINRTYLPYGAAGADSQARQVEQDGKAWEASPEAGNQRAMTKGNAKLYCNTAWDLVDACADKSFDLSKVADADLPEDMRGKSLDQKQAIVRELTAQREQYRKQIEELTAARRAFVAAKLKELAAAGDNTLQSAVITMLREQAAARNYTFE